jgi:hypothetical protein
MMNDRPIKASIKFRAAPQEYLAQTHQENYATLENTKAERGTVFKIDFRPLTQNIIIYCAN